MPLKEIANTDRVISITPKGGWTPGAPIYTEFPSTKAKANNKGILIKEISWTLPAGNCVLAGNNHNGGASTAKILPTISKIKEAIISGCPLAKGDKGICQGSFILVAPPFTVTVCNCDLEITDSGQTKAKGQ